MVSPQQLFTTPSKEKWKKIGTGKRTGMLVPLFSVYSKNSLGSADFNDLKLLVDFAAKTGNSIIQLLPMNEVGSLFCPYDSLSSFALEPMYISPSELPTNKKSIQQKIKDIQGKFPPSRPCLDSLGNYIRFFGTLPQNQRKVSLMKLFFDYGIKKEKIRLLREIYLEEGPQDTAGLKRFEEENSYWLLDFALFKALKDYHQGKAWWDWEEKYQKRDRLALESFRKEHQEEIDFQVWLQRLAYEQFKDAKAYAASKKVLLKGDLPILVSRDSADVWRHPEFFKLEFAAGAPPDMYATLGQRWGMPTYNWEKIAEDNYRYLKEKLTLAENFYDILRIDHVVGIFRIWSIPYDDPLENQGLNGFFDPRDESQWEAHGRNILSVIVNNTKILISAEDLGIIPKACPKALEDSGIPGNDVQRWVKDWKIKHDFLAPKDYRLLSVAMLSTHDTTNWPAWWENEAGTVDGGLFVRRCNERGIDYNAVKEKLFDLAHSRHGRLRWREGIDSVDKLAGILGKPREQLKDFIDFYENSYQEKEKLWKHLGLKGALRENCDAEILRAALKITLEARSLFCIQTLMDWLFLADIFKGDAYQYRINTPGTISAKNWSLVIPISLDDLLKHKVCKKIKAMITSAGRK